MKKQRTLLSCAIALTAALASTATLAAPIKLYGGGATLPANAYNGSDWLNSNPAKRLSSSIPGSTDPMSATSLFGKRATAASNPAYIQYCQTGSGTGRGVITGAKPDATAVCGDYSGPTPNGFSAVTARANFAASDAPLSGSDVSTFAANNSAYGSPIQFPAVAGAIAIIYNNADQVTRMNITEATLCRIFAGQVTNWKQIKSNLPSKPIKLVVRSDNSGTTFSFMNHLSAVCPTAQPTATTGFTTQSVFAAGAVGAVLPAGTIASSGNGGVIASVAATDGAIGYAEASDTKARQAIGGAPGLNWATLQKRPNIPAVYDEFGNVVTPAQNFLPMDPFTHTKKTLAVTAVSDKVISGNDANGRPIIVSQAPLIPAAAGCIQLVDPNAYATSALNAAGDYKNYPIVAISYLMGYYQNNGNAKLGALKGLMTAPYTIDNTVTTIGVGTGFSWLSIPATAIDATAKARVVAPATINLANVVRSCIK